ncbi:transporter substrate-binding domain-containing protein [Roseicyclus mahoneyensis]|uniref:Amino acid ABC transporter substrate-binding protein (PAAT family) n=1 Tax=Roseicyclus mahoneyensis TaxID=164332 RepID=A0A316G5J7_9RHOB|nr:transporter substrate-binding domain-containing protein [Roseicyclus mahoneyensis]PWK55872.1 amino acid ABC transporter substrate-binding protein (PAAT family) [Roseicyclus mahoneyensis]
MSTSAVDPSLLAELAPTGRLRAGINTGNFLLVSGQTADGRPVGVSPDVAAEIAGRLGVPLDLVCYPDPGLLADGAERGAWDIGNIGAEPQRARTIAFTAAYCQIESTYLVPAGSTITSIEEVDRPGRLIATKGRAAYGLWLENNLKHAELVRTDSIDDSFDVFVERKLDALAGLRPRLLQDLERLPGARILEGQFSAVQQSVGTPRGNARAAKWLADVVEELKASGFIAERIARHGVQGLSVAPPAEALAPG